MTRIDIPILTGARCTLRGYRPDDAPSLAAHADNRAIWRNLLDIFPSPYTLADAERWVNHCQTNDDGQAHFAIEVEGACAGNFTLRPPDSGNQDFLELGYWLGEAHWGRGVMTEAVALGMDFAFAQLDCRRIEARAYGWAVGSQRVLEKCGFTLEGRLRNRMFKDGELTDQCVYGILRCEWLARKYQLHATFAAAS